MPESHPITDEARCANCEAQLSGPYCAQCGQHAHGSARSMGVLLHDGWHVFTHLDGRLWRTLIALLLRPGFLTLEYFRDRRERYLPPVRLYLVISLLFFALVGLFDRVNVSPADARDGVAAVTADDDAAATDSKFECRDLRSGNDWISRTAPAVCERIKADGGRGFLRTLRANVPRMMFVFLPVFAASCLLLYWRPRRLYVEHLVFFLHLHAAMFLLGLLMWAVGGVTALAGALQFTSTAETVDLLAGIAGFVYSSWYIYRAMRNYYQQRRLRTLLKLTILSFVYLVCFLLTLALTAAVSILQV